MASVGLSKPQWMLHGLRGCGMASVSVTLHQWVWNGLWYCLSGCAWRQRVRNGLSFSGCIYGLSVCIYDSSDVAWVRDVLSGCGISLVCDMASVGASVVCL